MIRFGFGRIYGSPTQYRPHSTKHTFDSVDKYNRKRMKFELPVKTFECRYNRKHVQNRYCYPVVTQGPHAVAGIKIE